LNAERIAQQELGGDVGGDRHVNPWWVAGVAGAVALVVRLAYVLWLRLDVIFDHPIMDAAVHDGWARGHSAVLRIFADGVPYFRAPLYPWFLKLVYAVDSSYLAPRLVQCVLAAITVALVADLGRRFAGARAGLIGGLLLALCWPAIYFTGELLIVTFFMTLVVLALWLLVVAQQRGSRAWLLAGSLVLGIAACARPTALAMLPALAAAPWVVFGRSEARGRRFRIGLALSMVGLALLPGLGLTVRNKVVGDDWVFIASQGGVNLYIGNNPHADGRTAVVPGTRSTWLGGYEDTRHMAEVDRGRPLHPSEVSSYFFGKSLASWRDDPGAMLRLYGKKLRYLLGAGERPNNKNLHFWRARNPLLRQAFFPSWATLFALGLGGIFLLEKRRPSYFAWSFLALYALGLLPFFLNERFRLPLTVVLATFAGIPLARAAGAVLQRRYRLALVAMIPVLVLFGLSQLDRLDFRDDRVDADAFSLYTLGNLYARDHQYDAALRQYQRSQDTARRYHLRNFDQVEPMLQAGMIRCLLKVGHVDEAAEHLEVLSARVGPSPQLDLMKALVAVGKHDFQTAIPILRNILRADPDQPDALLAIAWCQVNARSFEAARKNFRRNQQVAGVNAEALSGLGVTELLGNYTEEPARRLFERALRLDPDTPAAHQYMAQLCRKSGDFEDMVFHLRQAMRLDPYNDAVRIFYNRLPPQLKELPRREG
jgi:tetratricopeptide (TPR) repeat protein